MAMRKKKPFVWVVMHYEIMWGERIDSVQFHVASSRRAAEKYISRTGVEPYSWWQVHPYEVDEDHFWDAEEATYYYSHTGRPLPATPVRRALNAYRRARKRDRTIAGAAKASGARQHSVR